MHCTALSVLKSVILALIKETMLLGHCPQYCYKQPDSIFILLSPLFEIYEFGQ